jgi:hypothetical protein
MKKESVLQMQIVEILSLYSRRNKFIFFSVPNEAVLMTCVSFGIAKTILFKILNFFKKMGMTPGVSDLVICKNGQTYFLELKSLAGAISKNQYIFRDNAINCGAMYAVVRNIDDFSKLMKDWRIF